MGNIYEPGPTEKTEWCNPLDTPNFNRLFEEINGTPRQSGWKPIAMEMVRKASRQKLKYADSPWRSACSLVFRKTVIDKMKPLLEEYGELLPLECSDAELWVYNPTVVLNALDDKASEGDRFEDGRFMIIDKYVFYPDVVKGVDIFRLGNRRSRPTFVSDRFVELWKSSGLVGLRFDKLWSSPE